MTDRDKNYITHGAVRPRPYLANAILVASLTITDAKGKPY